MYPKQHHDTTTTLRPVGSALKGCMLQTQVSPSDSIDVNLNSHHFNNSFESTPISSEEDEACAPNPVGEFQHLLQDFEVKNDPWMDSSFIMY